MDIVPVKPLQIIHDDAELDIERTPLPVVHMPARVIIIGSRSNHR